MSNNTLTINAIEKEVSLLRSFVIGIAGKDKEGEYRPEFVRKILIAINDNPAYKFTNHKKFLDLIRANH